MSYTEGQWGGLVNYECDICPYKTLDKWRMEEHYVRHTILPSVTESGLIVASESPRKKIAEKKLSEIPKKKTKEEVGNAKNSTDSTESA